VGLFLTDQQDNDALTSSDGVIMSEENFSVILRNLADDYFNDRIPFNEYRSKRKIILDKIDEEFNGIEQVDNVEEKSSIFMQTIKFFKGSDI